MRVDVATRDREQFIREVHQAYSRRLLRVVRRSTGGDTHWAEDVVQETMLRAWRHADLLRDGGYPNLLPWLVTVARNIVINERRATREVPWSIDEKLAQMPPAADLADHVADRAELTTALANLNRKHRDVIVDIYLRDQALADVALAQRLPVGTVKSRAHYALRAMRLSLCGQR